MFKRLGSLLDSNQRELKKTRSLVSRTNELEPEYARLDDIQLRNKTEEFKQRLSDGAVLDDLLPEAFAAVREASRRFTGKRHFDVQLMGGIALHQGRIAEMKTGEGKTLVATLPLYLNSLTGKGCHLVTVNDYLSKRDPHWMGPIFYALGVSVGSIQHDASFIYDREYESEEPVWTFMRPVTRREAYGADVTYGTNNELGFDYLRDNMVIDLTQCVQRPLNYAIVDEVDYILIDEARTPLIISGQAEEATQRYHTFARLVPRLKAVEDYTVDAKSRAAMLTDAGIVRMESLLRKEGLLKSPDLYDPSNYALVRYLESALKAHVLFRRDRDYVVRNGEVIIVDEFTGRMMPGRRYSEGLHQAIEAKERVKIQRESVTLASITFQNYFRLYEKLAGMTGTALTEAEEFSKIYKLDVVVIPTNRPQARKDHTDQVYKNEESKFRAVAGEIEQLHGQERPVLVGTTSIEKSELLSDLLMRRGVRHQVLNAKNHEKEAQVIAQAGMPGAVTVATNMAGRGVDIILGGNPDLREQAEWATDHDKVTALGGLHVIGTERHEARRIDLQLRGRAGRQGDPGSSRFYVSLQDEVMHRFGGDRVKGIMEWAGLGEDTPIENPIINRAIENAQVRVEGYHFEIRKHLVDYDDVVNRHREIIYGERKRIMSGADLRGNILDMVRKEISALVAAFFTEDKVDAEGLLDEAARIMPLPSQAKPAAVGGMSPGEIEDMLVDHAEELYRQKEAELGEGMRVLERVVMLRTLDRLWMEHLTMMEHMRQGIGLQAAGQRNPLIEYKKEGHALFQSLMANIEHDVVHTIFHASIVKKEAPVVQNTGGQQAPAAAATPVAAKASNADRKLGRNDPCPCGSGRKYKKCCGK